MSLSSLFRKFGLSIIISACVIFLVAAYLIHHFYSKFHLNEFLTSVNFPSYRHRSQPNSKCIRIVVPFVADEFPLFEWYLSFWMNPDMPVCGSKSSCVHLHFMLDAPTLSLNETQVDQISSDLSFSLSTLQRNQINSCVKSYSFSTFHEGSEDYRLGPFYTLKHLLLETHLEGYACMALMELDVVPIKPRWLDRLYEMCFLEGNFVVKGTAYGKNKKDLKYQHINRNCIWNIRQWDVLRQSLMIFDEYIFGLQALPTGYDVLLRHLFVRPAHPYLRKWRILSNINDKVSRNEKVSSKLLDVWSAGYINTPYIANVPQQSRYPCTKEFVDNLDKLILNVSDHLLLHCSKRTTWKSQASQCIRLIIPVMVHEEGSLYRTLYDLFREDACGKKKFNCYHVVFQLKVPKHRTNEFDEKILYLKDAISLKAQKTSCIWHHSFSIFEYEHVDDPKEAYLSLKHMVFESNLLGYSFLFVMETNVLPLVRGWLESIYDMTMDVWRRTTKRRAIVKGTPIKHVRGRNPEFGHLNRNCIWKVDDEAKSTLNKVFETMDKYIHLTSVLPTTHEILFRHLFLLPRNDKLIDPKWSGNDEGYIKWASALNFIYSNLGPEPFNQTSYLTQSEEFLAIGSMETKTFCADPNDASRKVLLEKNENYILAVCSPDNQSKKKTVS